MAGIEPASERFDPRTSTSVVVFLFSPDLGNTTNRSQIKLFEPESPLSYYSQHQVWHSDFVTPDPTIGQSTMRVDEVIIDRYCSAWA